MKTVNGYNRSTVAEAFLGAFLPAMPPGSGDGQGKDSHEKTGLECLETASKDLKQKTVIDFNPKTGFWTVKIGFLWGRDQSFVKAAGQCLEKVLPLLK